jgi:hypothetical protein
MGRIMKKYQIFTLLALLLLTVCFTIPIVGFYGTIDKIRNHQVDTIPAHAYWIWDLYSPFQYVNNSAPEGTEGSLEKLIQKRGEVGMASIPVWRVSLEAPNYPKDAFPEGIPVFFHLDGFSGEVHEMNTINHYIGMYPMERGGQVEMKLMPYLLLLMTLMMIGFLYWNSTKSWILMILPILFPVGFVVDFAAWLYWYGHNMQEWGAFTIKPFMPTVFGDGKVAQFTTHSYPTTGFYILVIVSILCILAVFSKNKSLKAETKDQ